jgi:hypothetical protein
LKVSIQKTGGIDMICPECGAEMKEGKVEARGAGSILQMTTTVTFVPQEDQGKWIRRHAISLKIDGEGYYCETCMKVFASFEEG